MPDETFTSPVRLFRRTDNGRLATPEQIEADGVGGAGVCRAGDPIPPGPLQEEVKQLLAELGLPEQVTEDEPEVEAKDASDEREDKAVEPPRARRSLLRKK